MGMRIAAGIWFLLTLVMFGGLLTGLGEGRPNSVVLSIAFAIITAWLGYRLLRRPTPDVALVAGCTAAFFMLLIVGAAAGGSTSLWPQGAVALSVVGLAGFLPLQWRQSATSSP